MHGVPPWAGFVVDFPNDEVQGGGDIQVYGGRNLAVALGEIFASLGCTDVSEPWSVADVGWEFDFNYRGRHSFLCRVQSFHPIFWLLFEGPTGKRAASAHLELWRKFASALEHDPRFDQVLWRTSEQGPPDWDEFSVRDDLRKPPLVEDLPLRPTKPRPKAAGGPAAPAVIGVWFVLLVGTLFVTEHTIHGDKAQVEASALAIAGLFVVLAVVLVTIDRRRKRRLDGSDEDPDRAP